MREITEIIIHCSATLPGQKVTAEDIDKWHKMRGWRKIGYHYVIRENGYLERGRDEWEIGAHCKGHNRHSIGVCYVGGLDKDGKPADTRTKAQKLALLNLLRELKRKYPKAKIYGHRDFAARDCPCFDARKKYELL